MVDTLHNTSSKHSPFSLPFHLCHSPPQTSHSQPSQMTAAPFVLWYRATPIDEIKWKSEADIYLYFLHHRHVRQFLLSTIQQLPPNPHGYIIYNPVMTYDVVLHAQDSEGRLVDQLSHILTTISLRDRKER